MFDIGFTELVLVAIIALIVLGPERLPHAVRTAGKWVGKFRNMFNQVKEQIERELDADEIRQQIHNDSIMQQLKKGKQDLSGNLDEVRASLKSMEFDLHASTEISQPGSETPNKEVEIDSLEHSGKGRIEGSEEYNGLHSDEQPSIKPPDPNPVPTPTSNQ